MEHFPVHFDRYEDAFGLLSMRHPVTAVVFVHGFDGNSRTTWVDFEGMIERGKERAVWSQCDLFFYSYDSRNQIPVLASAFLEFLNSVEALKGRDLITPGDETVRLIGGFTLGVPIDYSAYRGQDSYKSIVLVGHSTGALIIREAIRSRVIAVLKASNNLSTRTNDKEKKDDHDRLILRSRLRLFAPAHLGVLVAGKLGVAQHLPIIDRVIGGYLASNPLFQNLRHDSPTVLDIRKATEALYQQHKVECLKACSLFGELEEIVYIGGYTHDVPFQLVPGHNHTSICKPNIEHPKPLEFVMDASSTSQNA